MQYFLPLYVQTHRIIKSHKRKPYKKAALLSFTGRLIPGHGLFFIGRTPYFDAIFCASSEEHPDILGHYTYPDPGQVLFSFPFQACFFKLLRNTSRYSSSVMAYSEESVSFLETSFVWASSFFWHFLLGRGHSFGLLFYCFCRHGN